MIVRTKSKLALGLSPRKRMSRGIPKSSALAMLVVGSLLAMQYLSLSSPAAVLATPLYLPQSVPGTAGALATGPNAGATTILASSTMTPPTSNNTTSAQGRISSPAQVLPPKIGVGCYFRPVTNQTWKSVACLAQAQTTKAERPLVGGGSGMDGLSVSGKVLTEGFTTAWFSKFSGETDTAWGGDSFSLQANTNQFTGNNGQLDAVQFVEQSSPNYKSIDCVWNIDVTTQAYASACVSTPFQTLSSTFGADIVGTVTSQVLCFPFAVCLTFYYLTSTYMTPFGTWAVTAADSYGLHSSWTQTSGTILGLGGGSEAVFTHPTNVGSNVGVYAAGLNAAALVHVPEGTVESNNLNYQSTPSSACYGDGYCDMFSTLVN
jgi:hypothetical protein